MSPIYRLLLLYGLVLSIHSVLLTGCAPMGQTTVTSHATVVAQTPTFLRRAFLVASPATSRLIPVTSSAPTVPTAAARTPTASPTLAAMVRRDHIPVLCYHAVRDWAITDPVANRPYIVPIRTFAAQMAVVAHTGYHTITPDALLDELRNGTPLPSKPLLLTFDDGDATQWTNALPVVHSYHLTATFFIMTAVLDHPGYLTSKQVQALDQMGMTIGAHTWNHQRVTRYTGKDWDTQITQPKAQLEHLLQHPVTAFAYPYGLWNDEAISHLKQTGFEMAFQLNDRASPREPYFTLRRRIGNPYWNATQLIQALASDF